MIFRRSLLRELFNTSSAILIVLLTIVLTITLVRFLGQAASGQVDNSAVVALISFAALNNLSVLLQLTAFLTVLLVLSRSYRDSEMVVWQSAGLGLTSWLKPVLQFATPIVLAVAVLSFIVAPWANQQSSEFKARFEQRNDATRVSPGQFIESADGQKVVFVEGLKQDAVNVSNVFVSSIQSGRQGVTVSQTGQFEHHQNGDDFVVLFNGRRYDGTPGQSDYKVMAFERYGVRINSKPPDFSGDNSAKIKSTPQLIAEATPAALGELVWRIGLPVSVLSLVVLAIPLSFVNPRAGRSANLMIALLIYFTYSNAISLVQNQTSVGKMHFVVAWWLVHALVLAIAMGMLYWRNHLHRSWIVSLRSWMTARRTDSSIAGEP